MKRQLLYSLRLLYSEHLKAKPALPADIGLCMTHYRWSWSERIGLQCVIWKLDNTVRFHVLG